LREIIDRGSAIAIERDNREGAGLQLREIIDRGSAIAIERDNTSNKIVIFVLNGLKTVLKLS